MAYSKLTPEVEEVILNLVAAGNTLIHAARAAGVTSETARNWTKWGEEGREPYAQFMEKVDVAKAKAITDSVESVRHAARTDWRAAKFHLEYVQSRQNSPANIARQLEEILQVIEDVLGADEAKKVLRAIVERAGSEEASEPGAALRLVTSG